jgi:hypothetical protein
LDRLRVAAICGASYPASLSEADWKEFLVELTRALEIADRHQRNYVLRRLLYVRERSVEVAENPELQRRIREARSQFGFPPVDAEATETLAKVEADN